MSLRLSGFFFALVAEVATQQRIMPPWLPEKACEEFVGQRSLTNEERRQDTICQGRRSASLQSTGCPSRPADDGSDGSLRPLDQEHPGPGFPGTETGVCRNKRRGEICLEEKRDCRAVPACCEHRRSQLENDPRHIQPARTGPPRCPCRNGAAWKTVTQPHGHRAACSGLPASSFYGPLKSQASRFPGEHSP